MFNNISYSLKSINQAIVQLVTRHMSIKETNRRRGQRLWIGRKRIGQRRDCSEVLIALVYVHNKLYTAIVMINI